MITSKETKMHPKFLNVHVDENGPFVYMSITKHGLISLWDADVYSSSIRSQEETNFKLYLTQEQIDKLALMRG